MAYINNKELFAGTTSCLTALACLWANSMKKNSQCTKNKLRHELLGMKEMLEGPESIVPQHLNSQPKQLPSAVTDSKSQQMCNVPLQILPPQQRNENHPPPVTQKLKTNSPKPEQQHKRSKDPPHKNALKLPCQWCTQKKIMEQTSSPKQQQKQKCSKDSPHNNTVKLLCESCDKPQSLRQVNSTKPHQQQKISRDPTHKNCLISPCEHCKQALLLHQCINDFQQKQLKQSQSLIKKMVPPITLNNELHQTNKSSQTPQLMRSLHYNKEVQCTGPSPKSSSPKCPCQRKSTQQSANNFEQIRAAIKAKGLAKKLSPSVALSPKYRIAMQLKNNATESRHSNQKISTQNENHGSRVPCDWC